MSHTRSRKRRTSTREDLTEKRRTEEKEELVVSSATEDEEGRFEEGEFASESWENSIGEEEEKYLANTREELYELIMQRKTFGCKVTEKSLERLLELMNSLIKYGRENVESLLLYRVEEEEEGRLYEQTGLSQHKRLMAFQQRRMDWLFREIRGRILWAEKANMAKEERVKALEEENKTLRKRLEVVERERGELLNRQDPRSVERKDASVSTETEVPEVEMAGNLDLPPPVEVPQGWRGALETLIEEKVMETLSRVGVSTDGKTGGVKIPHGNGGGQTPQVMNTWAEVVRKRKRKPPSTGMLLSLCARRIG